MPRISAVNDGKWLGLGSGIGLVVASMVGAGVFLSAGFMAQALSAGSILIAWLLGALLAMAGARAYAEVAILIPRSGGEYRYLSELYHPALGYLAGWASLLVGFAAPTAISAYAASAFGFAMLGLEGGPVRWAATGLIAVLSLFHSAGLQLSKWTQNGLVLLKGTLLLCFLGVGLAFGSHRWPDWHPPGDSSRFAPMPFAMSLFYVAYAFSGWNAAAYAAEEFHEPKRDVPRAMLIGCALVGVLYLLVNWVLVANLSPEQAKIVYQYEEARVTLGHLVAANFLGEPGSLAMSGLIAIAMLSSTSAMLLVGPRVYAEMARDGFLPARLRAPEGKPPSLSVLLQALLAVLLLHLHSVGELLSNVAGVLVLFSALVALGLFFVKRRRAELAAPRPQALLAAAVYVGASVWMLYNALRAELGLVPWLVGVAAAGLGAYFLTERRRRRSQ